MALKLVTEPADWPVSLEEAKAHLREDSSDFDDQIEAFIDAATDYVDGPSGFLGRALIDQTWDLYLDRFPCATMDGARLINAIEIPLPPLIEVLGLFYLDAAGGEQQFAAASYTVDTASEPGRVVLNSSGSWPTLQSGSNQVRIRFRAGYVTADSPPVANVPGSILSAIKILIGDLYANRESQVIGASVARLPWSAEALLRRHRIYKGFA